MMKSAAPPYLQSPYHPPGDCLSHMPKRSEMLSHAPSVQDQDGEQLIVNQGDPTQTPQLAKSDSML